LAKIFLTLLAIERLLSFSPHLTFALALSGENKPSKSCVETNEKTNKFQLSRSLSSIGQSITRFDCHKVVMAFRNGYKFKKKLVSLDWFEAKKH